MVSLVDDIGSLEQREFSESISVHKFGGSSLATKERLINVSKIIESQTNEDDFIVVSANGSVTDLLVEIADGKFDEIDQLEDYYQNLVLDTLSFPNEILKDFRHDIINLKHQKFTQDEVLSLGEIWSAKLLVALLKESEVSSQFVDARELLATDSIDDYRHFDTSYFDRGFERIVYGNFGKRLVITGFIASDLCGNTITLGRNGSDYSAALLARFAQAEKVTLWTDVCGVFSADPRIIRQAHQVSSLTYDEAKALAAVGTNVLHQKTIGPLVTQRIPLYVRSSLTFERKGTCISALGDRCNSVKSIAIKRNLLKLRVKLNESLTPEKLIHTLFESHVIAIRSEYDEDFGYLTLLVEDSLLEKTTEILGQYDVRANINKAKRTIIAVVGESVCEHKELISRILETSQVKLLEKSHRDSAYFIVRSELADEALIEIYRSSFGAKPVFPSPELVEHNSALAEVGV